ncbi:MAG: homoserine O-acetyltransferase [Campylobacterales bacterium]|nr:homoserine O-acetyltransferase [Campylobacterales bacterium]
MKITTKKERFLNPLYLESGRIIEPYEITYETYGEMNEEKSNIIVVTHALTGSFHVAGRYADEPKAGWWDKLIGPNKAIDTNKYFVICSSVIGSCTGSTGPISPMYPSHEPYRFKFPVVTIKDMVKAQRILFDKLGINKVKAIIGGSMGGMQALQFAVSFPNFAQIVIPMACTWATKDWAIAFNKVAMESIIRDSNFKGGYYDIEEYKKSDAHGFAVGRMAGFISYLSPYSMDKKFSRGYVNNDGLYELFGKYQIERYLDYNGYNFPKWFDPLSYLYLMKAINIFDVSRGYDSLSEAIKEIKAKVYLISFDKDFLFFADEMRELHECFKSINKECFYENIKSDYGHDAFLVEVEKFDNLIVDILEGKV